MALLLVDGDVIAYRAGFATDKTKYLVSSGESYHTYESSKEAKECAEQQPASVIWSRKDPEPEDKALLLTNVMIGDIRDRFAAENLSLRICLSGVGNFRDGIATRATYKGNRSAVRPVHFSAIRQLLLDKGAVLSQGEEADDLMGIAATANPGSVICSIDKDLRQIPGRHYDFVAKEEYTVSVKEAQINLYTQVIAGDPVDNVPGCQGYGAVKARKALEGCRNKFECWYRALEIYTSVYGAVDGPRFARETAELVYIRRVPGDKWIPPQAKTTTNAYQAA